MIITVQKQLQDPSINPRDVQRSLGRAIVALYHGDDSALKAEQHFEKVIVNKDIPDTIDEVKLSQDTTIVELLSNEGLTKSKGEARRMIEQGAVRIEGEKIKDMDLVIKSGKELIIKVGKRKFLKVK